MLDPRVGSANAIQPHNIYSGWTTAGGERYDIGRYPGPEGSLDTEFARQAPAVRQAIYNEVFTRQGPLLSPTVEEPSSVRVGEAYPANWESFRSTSRDADLAARQASFHSRCEVPAAYRVLVCIPAQQVCQPPIPPREVSPSANVDVAVTAPVRFFAGGTEKPQNVVATPGPFRCSSCRVPPSDGFGWGPDAIVRSVDMRATFASTGGFSAWRHTSTSQNSPLAARTWSLEFYAGAQTNAQQMQANVTGSGSFDAAFRRIVVSYPGGVDLNGNVLPRIFFHYYDWGTYPLAVAVNPAQVTRDIVGATAVPRNG